MTDYLLIYHAVDPGTGRSFPPRRVIEQDSVFDLARKVERSVKRTLSAMQESVYIRPDRSDRLEVYVSLGGEMIYVQEIKVFRYG